MLTNRCNCPLLISRPAMPLCRDSRSSITSPTVAPLASTDFSPPVWVRRMVGMDTGTAMRGLQGGAGGGDGHGHRHAGARGWVVGWCSRCGSVVVGDIVRAGVREHVTLDDVHVFLG